MRTAEVGKRIKIARVFLMQTLQTLHLYLAEQETTTVLKKNFNVILVAWGS